jgi:hypothetical protein
LEQPLYDCATKAKKRRAPLLATIVFKRNRHLREEAPVPSGKKITLPLNFGSNCCRIGAGPQMAGFASKTDRAIKKN